MTERQGSGSVEATHESRDSPPIVGTEMMKLRAADYFDRRLRRNAIVCLVRIHHEKMQAVCSTRPRRSHAGDFLGTDDIVGGGKTRSQVLEPATQ